MGESALLMIYSGKSSSPFKRHSYSLFAKAKSFEVTLEV